MAWGVKDSSNELIFNIEEEPFSSAPNKRKFCPMGPQKSAEIVRRAQAMNIVHAKSKQPPQPAGWKSEAMDQRLVEHPIDYEQDVQWLKMKVDEFRTLLQTQKEGEAAPTDGGLETPHTC